MDVTAISQPAIFAVQAGLAALWRSWGVEPDAVIGHSVGEVAAAHVAGVFGLEDAARVIYYRGQCMELASSRGRMLAVGLPREEAEKLIAPYGSRVALAAVNSPTSMTLSGEPEALEVIAEEIERREAFCRFLQVHYAFHSSQMDPVRSELLKRLDGLSPRAAAMPLVSTVLARRIDGPEMGAEYWWHNVRQTVLFADGVERLAEMGCAAALELSPHPVLASAVAECYQERGKKISVTASLRRKEDDRPTLLRALGQLYTLGQPVDWSALVPGGGRFVRLPSYPWQRERFWHESEESADARLGAAGPPAAGPAAAHRPAHLGEPVGPPAHAVPGRPRRSPQRPAACDRVPGDGPRRRARTFRTFRVRD
jgi:acyl transferase domain-containing protein